jgi:putative sigma-54 modulation protein
VKIDITMQQTCADNKISCQIARRVRLALSRFSTAIRIITVRITDINGPKGGVDMRCVVAVKLAKAGEVIVQGQGKNTFSALNYCLPRVSRTITRSLERRRDSAIRLNRRKKSGVDEKNSCSTDTLNE